MRPNAQLMRVSEAADLIRAGKTLSIAGDEQALRQLPAGNWIGGTIPYFMAAVGGVVTRDQVFVNEIEVGAEPATLRFYDIDNLPNICRNAPDNGFTFLIIPAFSECHASFARNAPNYEDMFMKPLLGWIAGVHLEDLGKSTPKTVLGPTGEFSDQMAVAMDVSLPPTKFAQIDIVNLFKQGQGDEITFSEGGFSATECRVNGRPANLADYMVANKTDTRLPLVADYCGAMINVSVKAVDEANHKVEFYAPVFPGTSYRFAAPVNDYLGAFQAALPSGANISFSCNCILNYLYSGLEGKRTANVVGPITFGEIGYQLLNQTMVYLTVHG